MAMPPPNQTSRSAQLAEKGSVKLEVGPSAGDFSKHILFNWFQVDKIEDGALVHLAWIARNHTVEVDSFIVSKEGLEQVKSNSEKYIQAFTAKGTPPSEFPSAKISPPQFANFLRFARSGSWAEIAFLVIPIMEIAAAANGQKRTGAIQPLPVAIAHSGNIVHEQLVLSLLATL